MRQWLRRCGIGVAIVALVASVPVVVSAQTVEDLLAKNFAARGGLDKLKAINTIKLTGTVVAGGQEMQMVLWTKRPNLARQEMTIQGIKIVQAFDGQRAWMINPVMGSSAPQPLPQAQSNAMRDKSDFDGALVDYKAKGSKVELVGPDSVEGKKAYRLNVTRKDGAVTDLYLDAETGLEVKAVSEVKQNGQTFKVETLPSDYKSVSGVMMPYSIKTVVNGQPVNQVKVTSIEIGIPIEDSIFKMPKGTAPTAR